MDAQSEKTVIHFVDQIRALFGPQLVCVALYGSAAGADFVPGRSNLNFVVVAERLTFAHLKALHPYMPRWRKLGVATPLLLDRRFLERGRDVFPMEFHDIKAQHRVLYGEELFTALAIDGRHLRYQAEHEVRGKLLRLRALYAEVGAQRKRLEALMLDSVKTFLIVMRNLIRLRGGQGHPGYVQTLDQFEAHFAVHFPTMRRLVGVKLGGKHWAADIDETFRDYIEEVERLVELVDHIMPDGTEAAQ